MHLKKPYDENEIIASVQQKNPDAFNKLYDRYAPALYTAILQIAENEETGNNVLLKVFMIIWRTIKDFDSSKAGLFTWMLQIARAEAIAATESSGYQDTSKSLLISGKETSDQLSLRELDNFGLKKVIQNLKDEQKTVIDLYYFKGLSSGQIARVLSIPEDDIKSAIRTSLFEIRVLLSKKQ